MRESDDRIEPIIAAVLRGDATPGEQERVRAWRQASAENEEAFRQTARLWQLLEAAPVERRPSPAPDARKLIQRAGVRRLVGEPSDPRRRRSVSRWLVAGAVAAAVVIAVGLRLRDVLEDAGSLAATEFTTGRAETATVSLRDGSIVRLGPESRLQVLGGGATRSVSFHGRAFFAIAHDRARPFQIRTPAGDVMVLGTRFDLETGPRDLRLVVVEGRVRLSTPGQETVIQRGQLGRVLSGVTVPPVAVPDIQAATTWLGTFYAFQSTPLAVAAAEIARRSGWNIRVADRGLLDRTVTGYFTEPDPSVMIRVICAAVLADCDLTDRTVVMRTQ